MVPRTSLNTKIFWKPIDNASTLGLCVGWEADLRIWNFQGHGSICQPCGMSGYCSALRYP
ncbi:hypothetical protein K443DRAFT_245553 [Laccaria amethystina LaAM-08-1]|uniref:Uncharacterized protein n=1 Tax=Laccaria amethystina LaAM-08-1 TaxID=1095629 RepID=A0A0C9X7U5_9AGAR|nr:hypothetical protein K443DRAFT_245553 [Laccaria amethystina LaAM-08-1]